MADTPKTNRVDWSGPPSAPDHRMTNPVIQPIPSSEPLDYARPSVGSIKYRVSWVFAVLAMLAGITAWVFDVAWLTSGVSVMGIIGFLAALVSGVCVFIGELIIAPHPGPSWFRYAAWLSLGSVLFVAVVTAIVR
jgi:hypothetical protein